MKKGLDRIAKALDLTHAVGERGPRTFNARQRLATHLDTGCTYRGVKTDLAWLTQLAENLGK